MPLTRPITKHIRSIRYRRKHFQRKHRYAQAFADAGYDGMALTLRQCQETEALACCSNCGRAWWIVNRCRQRICPLCSYEVSKKRAHYLECMTRHMTHPKMLTLTMPAWPDDPQDGIRFIRKGFARLRRTKLFRAVRGGAYQIEIKIKPHLYHIHIHALLDVNYLPYQQIWTAWKTIIHAEVPQIDIRSASDRKAREYICKYAAKSAGFDAHPEIIVAWYEATKGQRLFATFGKWYNASIDELDTEHHTFVPQAVCPYCKAVKTMFLARDGPYIYGRELWSRIKGVYLRDCMPLRDMEGARAAVETPLTETEKEEMKCRRNSTHALSTK